MQAAQTPRIRVANDRFRTLGDDCIALNEALGINLLEWQKMVVRDWLAVDERGQFVHRRCGLSVPRQSGKSFLTIAVVNYLVLVLHMRVAFTAHNYSTVGDIFDRFKRLYGFKAKDPNASNRELNELVKNVRGATSRECIELVHVETEEGEYDPCAAFSTRTDSSLRGQSFDVLVCDESQELTAAQLSSILPVTNAGSCANPLTIFLGTPETPASRGEVFGNVRKGAINGAFSDICWHEWSVSEVGNVMDRSRWYDTNPSLGILSNESSLLAASGSMAPFDFAQEYMGYWSSQSANAVIGASSWEACKTEDPPMEGVTCFAVKFAPDGSSYCISAAIRTDGGAYVECIHHRPITDGLAFAADFIEKQADRAAQVVVDGKSHSGALVDMLKARGFGSVVLVTPSSGDVATACATFADAVVDGRVSHMGQKELTESATRSVKRRIGSGGGWGFDGDANPILVESCALAYWQAVTTKRDPNRKVRIA